MREGAPLVFFLGGQDLEMAVIRELLEEAGARFFDGRLGWGAKASSYEEEIRACLEGGGRPVLVELTDDLDLDPEGVIVADHHGKEAGRDAPTSIEQVFRLLELPPERWSRRLELVAANDRGGPPALAQAGATREEIAEIRAADRAAQGVTEEEERQAAGAAEKAEGRAGGRLTVARLPLDKTTPLVDRLHPELGGPGFENLLVLSPGEVNFFGSGELVRALEERYPGGWSGGELPQRGFWGHKRPVPGVVELLEERLESVPSAAAEGRSEP